MCQGNGPPARPRKWRGLHNDQGQPLGFHKAVFWSNVETTQTLSRPREPESGWLTATHGGWVTGQTVGRHPPPRYIPPTARKSATSSPVT